MAAKKKGATALVLRTCNANLTSHNRFQWPDKVGAVVEAPDWIANEECGNGLHGWLYGVGDHSASNSVNNADAKWMVVEVVLADVVMLGGKCKFPRCVIKHIGDRKSATEYLLANEPRAAGAQVIGASVTVGDKQSSTTGYKGTATAGDGGTATAGKSGTATAGKSGTATAGKSGTATAGDGGTATAGDGGTATAGDWGTATAGKSGTATAGELGEIRIRYWHEKAQRYRTVIGYIGEDGLKPGVKYKLNTRHKFVEA